jgi:hypothetical protein
MMHPRVWKCLVFASNPTLTVSASVTYIFQIETHPKVLTCVYSLLKLTFLTGLLAHSFESQFYGPLLYISRLSY